MLKNLFKNLLSNYTEDNNLINELWSEIQHNYTDINRYYHNLNHLENLHQNLNEVKNKIEDWDCVLFTLFYHDIIYNPLKNDNEEASSLIAEKRMRRIDVPQPKIEKTISQIIATKTHDKNFNSDTNYFLDSDISILGQNETKYKEYSKNVRLEYQYYPIDVYNKGRIEILTKFLKQVNLYKTDYFQSKYEEQARRNITNEIKFLSKN